MKTVTTVIAALALLLAACTTTDPYTGEQKVSNTAKGAGIGALGGAAAGAIVGAITGGGKSAARGALIGAGIGAIGGGGVGYYMDQQEEKLRQRLARTGVGVRRVGDTIYLVMPSNITFDVDQTVIKPDFYPVLADVALVLNEFEKTYVEVQGHTDSSGSDAYNMDLSQRRANSVAQFMIGQNVLPGRLIVTGFGETQPIASNATEAGRAQNRRVEIQISPFTG